VIATIKRRYYGVTEAAMRPVARLGIKPNHLTIVGLILVALVGIVIANGYLLVGGILTLLSTAFDNLDGSLARVSGQVTKFGAFFDASLDRYADTILLAALWPSIAAGDTLTMWLLFAAMAGGFAVPYTKARAEAVGYSANVGLFPREIRVIVYAAGLILGQVVILIWILALMNNVTAVQRLWHVYRQSRA
jgi:CDP-diacylglycerol--glycerol-3-phosphate 3-phosphatidyltransferase